MINQGTAVIKFTPPLRRTIARWVGTMLCNLLLELKRNSWHHEPYNFFFDQPQDEMNNNNNNNFAYNEGANNLLLLANMVTI